MEAALYDKDQGYYCRTDLERWGRAGDYRTSSEISALFAATIRALLCNTLRSTWLTRRFVVVEAGGGAGNFAAEFWKR